MNQLTTDEFIGAAIPDEGYFHLKTHRYLHFQVKIDVITAWLQIALSGYRIKRTLCFFWFVPMNDGTYLLLLFETYTEFVKFMFCYLERIDCNYFLYYENLILTTMELVHRRSFTTIIPRQIFSRNVFVQEIQFLVKMQDF